MRLRAILSLAVAAVSLASCGGSTQERAEAAPAARRLASAAHVAADYNTTVQQLYVAYFGRPADPGGLQNWTTALAALGIEPGIDAINRSYLANPTVKAMVDGFATSDESASQYPVGIDTVYFVNTVYQNLLGRQPELDGLLFWSKAIDVGGLTRQQAAISIMAGALANSSDQGHVDAAMVNNRVAVASAFTNALVAKNKTAYYFGYPGAVQGRLLLSPITSAFDPANAQSYADCYVGTLGAIMTVTAIVALPPACSTGPVTIASGTAATQ